MSVINLLNLQTIECVHAIQNFIFHSEYFNIVIELGMGKSSKKKPMTKKDIRVMKTYDITEKDFINETGEI